MTQDLGQKKQATTAKRKVGQPQPKVRRAPTTSPWIVRTRSSIHGRGVRARTDIPAGTKIIEYLGELITKAESNRREILRQERAKKGSDGCVYIFELNRRFDLDGRASWNTARLLNHSCAPNCCAETIRGHIWLLADRDIAAGEELTFDYGYRFKDWPLHPCRCGATGCVGFIVGRDQRWRLRRLLRGRSPAAREALRAEAEKAWYL